MSIDRKTTVAAMTMVGLTSVLATLAVVALTGGTTPEVDELASSAGATATIIENGSIVVIALDPVVVTSGENAPTDVRPPSGGTSAGVPDGPTGATSTTVRPSPPVSGSTTTVATSVTTTLQVTTTIRPVLYTVSGWPIPSNYSVPSKWWGSPIPDYPLGTWTKCALEDDGWACENG